MKGSSHKNRWKGWSNTAWRVHRRRHGCRKETLSIQGQWSVQQTTKGIKWSGSTPPSATLTSKLPGVPVTIPKASQKHPVSKIHHAQKKKNRNLPRMASTSTVLVSVKARLQGHPSVLAAGASQTSSLKTGQKGPNVRIHQPGFATS